MRRLRQQLDNGRSSADTTAAAADNAYTVSIEANEDALIRESVGDENMDKVLAAVDALEK